MQNEEDRCTKPVYIGGGPRGPQMFIPDAVTLPNGCLPIMNQSDQNLVILKNRVIARGKDTTLNEDIAEPINVCAADIQRNLFTMDDLDQVVEPSLSTNLRQKLLALINEYRDCFARETSELGKAKQGELEIRLNDEEPVTYRPYRLSYAEREIVRRQISELKEHGLIRDSSSPYTTPILLTKKKDGTTRMCCDY